MQNSDTNLPEAELKEKDETVGEGDDETKYPPLKSVIPVMMALYLVVFLVALDRTIIATAIPQITDDFHSIDDIGWYGSSYLITGCAFQLFFGKVYTLYSPKWVYIVSILIFEAGSALCGAAPNSTSFIVGRAIAGFGSAGLFSGVIVIIVHTIPLRQRPMYIGMMGSVFGIASVAGPLLGGVFTQKATWRWCFYINLPVGAVALVIVILLLKVKLPQRVDADKSFTHQIARLDPLGTICFLPSMVCLLLALQWGGTTYAWNDGRIIALFVIFAVLLIAFIAIQIWKKEDATVPPRIFAQRSILAGFWFMTFLYASMIIFIYYLPLWFQAIKGVDAVKSGIMNIPMIISLVISSIISGVLVSVIGYYTPFMIFSCIMTCVGAGLMTTFTPDTGHPKWIGYQVIFGLGLGSGMHQANVAAQTVLSKIDVPIGSSVMFFGQQLGGAIFIAVAQNIFTNKFTQDLESVPGLKVDNPAGMGATAIRNLIKDPVTLDRVLQIYNDSLLDAFRVALGVACVMIFGAAAMEWRSVKGKEKS